MKTAMTPNRHAANVWTSILAKIEVRKSRREKKSGREKDAIRFGMKIDYSVSVNVIAMILEVLLDAEVWTHFDNLYFKNQKSVTFDG